jgi:F-type H+-transporting ATPase subunit gamma
VAGNSKVIRKRIKSVASTKKITRTMEMVATSKLQKTQGRVVASRPYMAALTGLMEKLSGAIEQLGLSPLFERREPVKRVLVLLITANRGLCGGFNANLVKAGRVHLANLEAEGVESVLWVAGKKGISALRFLGVEMANKITDLSDNPSFEEAEAVAAPLLEQFLTGEVDRVDLVYADFQSVARQPPVAQTLLPVGASAEDEDAGASLGQFLFEPSPNEILDELGPAFVKNLMYRVLLSSVASEQIARRIAMKNATDNAGEMEKSLTREYNKARQAMITQEIAEIVGGVEALK